MYRVACSPADDWYTNNISCRAVETDVVRVRAAAANADAADMNDAADPAAASPA